MSWRARAIAASIGLSMLCACASRPALSPAVTLAQASTLRGAQAFARGDLKSAQHEYTIALHIHESLADVQERASSLLSLARVAVQAGRIEEALSAVNQILADPSQLGLSTVITAHGRAAALHMAQGDIALADQHLLQAVTACAGTCSDAGALAVLRARLALTRQQPTEALQLASYALAMPSLAHAPLPAPTSQSRTCQCAARSSPGIVCAWATRRRSYSCRSRP